MAKLAQPAEFVGWWEIDFYLQDGKSVEFGDVIERIDPDGRYEVFRDGKSISRGQHVEFCSDPDGFTNTIEDEAGQLRGRQLVIFRIGSDRLEVCKAAEEHGRPDRFHSPEGSPIVHSAVRRIAPDDPRIPR